MKRLPFALVAISLSIPVVACLNSSSDEGVVGSEDNLSEETKTACNFGFTAVEKPLEAPVAFGAKSEYAKGKRVLFGNFDKDAKLDFVVAGTTATVQAFIGKGDGTFKALEPKRIDVFDRERKRVALSTVAVGDFDGDKIQDVLLASTSTPKGENPDPLDVQVDYRVLFGKDDGSFAFHNQATLPAIKEKISFHVAGDLDGDGADDVVIVTAKGQTALFGQKNKRDLVPAPIAYENASERVLAYINPKTDKAAAALVLVTADKVASLTFDAARKATPTEAAYAGFDKDAWPVSADLDQNGSTELSMLANKLSIVTPGSEPLTFAGVAGRTVTAIDFDKNGKSELVYSVSDATKLYAACGYEPGAKALAAVELPIAYSGGTFLAGTPDLNGDGKPDFVTVPVAGGDLKVYLGAGKADPAPALTVLDSNLAASPDAGTDTGTPDTGTTTPDTGTDTGTTVTVDSGADTGTTVTVDSGVDSGTTVTVDAGADAGPRPPKDAGTTKPDQGDDDDDTEVGNPDDEESGPEKTPTKKPSTKPSSSSGSVTITPKQPAQSVDDGCSTSPASHGSSTTALGGIFAAMLLLGRRRSKKK